MVVVVRGLVFMGPRERSPVVSVVTNAFSPRCSEAPGSLLLSPLPTYAYGAIVWWWSW